MNCVLLHGLGQSAASWNDTVKYMDQASDIYCPEMSEWIQNKTSCYSNLYVGLEKYCERLEGPLNLCGLSLGGILALQYGIEHPDRVNSLALIGARYVMPKGLLKVQNALFRLMPKGVFQKMGFEKEGFISLCGSMMELDFREGLGRLRCPALVVCGEKDRANKAASVQMKEQIQNAEFLMVSGAGHEVNQDAPDTLGRAIRIFLKRISE